MTRLESTLACTLLAATIILPAWAAGNAAGSGTAGSGTAATTPAPTPSGSASAQSSGDGGAPPSPPALTDSPDVSFSLGLGAGYLTGIKHAGDFALRPEFAVLLQTDAPFLAIGPTFSCSVQTSGNFQVCDLGVRSDWKFSIGAPWSLGFEVTPSLSYLFKEGSSGVPSEYAPDSLAFATTLGLFTEWALSTAAYTANSASADAEAVLETALASDDRCETVKQLKAIPPTLSKELKDALSKLQSALDKPDCQAPLPANVRAQLEALLVSVRKSQPAPGPRLRLSVDVTQRFRGFWNGDAVFGALSLLWP